MQKRNAVVVADDSEGHHIEVVIRFRSKNGLVRDEVNVIIRSAARKAAQMIKELDWTDFAEENTRIRL